MNNKKLLTCANCGMRFDATNIKCPNCNFLMRKLYMDSKNHIGDIVDDNIKSQYKKLNDPVIEKESSDVIVSDSTILFDGTVFFTKSETAFKLSKSLENQPSTQFYKDTVAKNTKMLAEEFKYFENLSGKGKRIWKKMTAEVISKVFEHLATIITVPDVEGILNQESPNEIRDNVLGYLYNATSFESQFETGLSEVSQVRSQLLNLANEHLDFASQYRKLRKDSRGRFGFIAFSPKGVAKGYLESTALNATTGIAHSIFNAMGNIKDQWKVRSKLNRVLEDILNISTIESWLERDLKVIEEVARAYALYICHSHTNEETVSAWQTESNLFLNLYPYLGKLKDKKKCLLKGLQYDPYNSCFYYYLLRDFPDYYRKNKDNLNDFAQKLGIDIHSMQEDLDKAKTFNGVQYDSIEQCLDISSRTFNGVLYDTVEQLNDVVARTYNDITYDTVEERNHAEQGSIYNGKKYSSPEAANEAKSIDDEKEMVKEIIANVNRNDRDSLLKAIHQLESMNLNYNRDRLTKLKKRYNELGYEKPIEKFKSYLNSFDEITENSKKECINLIRKAKKYATEQDKKEINQIIADEVGRKVNRLIQQFDDNVLKYENMVELFHKKTQKIYPPIGPLVLGGFGIFVRIAFLGSIASSIFCLIHFFLTLGTGYTLADGMFFGYLVIAFILSLIIFDGYDVFEDFIDAFDTLPDKCYNSYWAYHAKHQFESIENCIGGLSKEYDNYCDIMKKTNCGIVTKKLPEVPKKFSQTKEISLAKEKIINISNKFGCVFIVFQCIISIAICIVLLLLILNLSPPKETGTESNTNTTTATQTPDLVEEPQISKKNLTMKVGQSHKLKLINEKGKIKWSSTNDKIANVSSKGKVHAKKSGKTKIKAKTGKKEYICKVTVK